MPSPVDGTKWTDNIRRAEARPREGVLEFLCGGQTTSTWPNWCRAPHVPTWCQSSSQDVQKWLCWLCSSRPTHKRRWSFLRHRCHEDKPLSRFCTDLQRDYILHAPDPHPGVGFGYYDEVALSLAVAVPGLSGAIGVCGAGRSLSLRRGSKEQQQQRPLLSYRSCLFLCFMPTAYQ